MGRHIFVIEENVLLNLFYCAPNLFVFFISSTSAPKNKSKRRAQFSECGGAYERLERKKSQYTHYKKLDYTTDCTLYGQSHACMHNWTIISSFEDLRIIQSIEVMLKMQS